MHHMQVYIDIHTHTPYARIYGYTYTYTIHHMQVYMDIHTPYTIHHMQVYMDIHTHTHTPYTIHHMQVYMDIHPHTPYTNKYEYTYAYTIHETNLDMHISHIHAYVATHIERKSEKKTNLSA